MLANHPTRGRWRKAAGLLLLLPLLLTACGGNNANATPTMGVQAIYTAAFQTLAAQQATQQALNPPTSTPAPPPTPLPTLPLASPLPTLSFSTSTPGGSIGGGSGACDSSAFISDVTIPDNSTIDPGKSFTKTWALMNNGTCTWGSGYKLAFLSGDQMGGVLTPLANSVPPGTTINISVKMTAPTTNGSYKGTWTMQNAANQNFGVQPYVLIKVGAGATATAGPSPTAAAACTSTCNITISANVPDFKVAISGKSGATDCTVPSGGHSCTFTVPAHWDGTVTLSKGTYTFNSNPYTFTDVTHDQNISFTGTPGKSATATPTP